MNLIDYETIHLGASVSMGAKVGACVSRTFVKVEALIEVLVRLSEDLVGSLLGRCVLCD